MGIVRLILALTVVIGHSAPIMGYTGVGGQMAVESFFIISGFYMTMILSKKYLNHEHGLKLFYTNRFLRLFPVYLIVLLSTVLLSAFSLIHGPQWGIWTAYIHKMNISTTLFFIINNIIIYTQDAVMFLQLNASGGLAFARDFQLTSPKLFEFLFVPQAWSLSLELTFYLIAPFLVKKKVPFIIGLMSLSLLTRIALSAMGLNDDPWSYRFFPNEIVFFLAGILSYKIYSKIKNLELSNKLLAIFSAPIFIFIASYQYISNLNLKSWLFLSTMALVVPFLFQLSKNNKLDRYLGELSYPIYISHILFFYILTQLKMEPTKNPYFVPLLVCISIAFSVLMIRFVINPIDRIRQKRVIDSTIKETSATLVQPQDYEIASIEEEQSDEKLQIK